MPQYSAPDIPRFLCQFCREPVWVGATTGRIRNDAGGSGVSDPAHTCQGYDNGLLRQGEATPPPPVFLADLELQIHRASAQRIAYMASQYPPTPEVAITLEGEEENVPENAWWLNTTLPQPFLWVNYPPGEHGLGIITTVSDHPDYADRIVQLKAWAEQNGLTVRPSQTINVWVEAGSGREPVALMRPYRIFVGRENPEEPYEFDPGNEWAEDFTCVHCGQTHIAYTASCQGRAFQCWNCGMRVEDGITLVDTGRVTACTDCAHTCEIDGCESWVVGDERLYCEEHRVDAYCVYCDRFMERSVNDEPFFQTVDGGGACCESCRELVCENCNRYYRRGLTWNSDLEMNVCRRCLFVGADGTTGEAFDEDADMTNKAMQIPTIPGRENVRQCGVEIEGANGDGNGDDLAMALYGAGLSTMDHMGGYHSGTSGFAHVERDSSVDWEVVIGPLNPASQTHVRNLNSVIRTIREHVKDGTLGLDLRAGCHIHVEAARTSLTGAFNLNLLFAYLEDVIFRLAAARWPVHRAIMDTHYTAPIPKDLRKLQFARQHTNDEDARYYALSFQNYFNRVLNSCHCGAVRYDSWEECGCDLGKCTFEFRVFNTTANPRKLHAYLALCQALVAKAMSLGDLDNASDTFPALAFRTRRFKDMDETEQEEIVGLWRDRLAWMFNELPLTDAEKESLAYCIRHSELDTVGEDFIESLLPTQEHEEAIA